MLFFTSIIDLIIHVFWQHHIASYFEYESSKLEIELLKDREEKFGSEEEENAVGEQDMMDCGPEN